MDRAPNTGTGAEKRRGDLEPKPQTTDLEPKPQTPDLEPTKIMENQETVAFLPRDGSGIFYEGAPFTVLGVGNPIMGDDGIGVNILGGLYALLESRPAWQARVAAGELAFVEGGIGGMELVPVVQDAHHLLILDSIAPGEGGGTATSLGTGARVPGQVLHFTGDHVPRLLSMKVSPHQVGLIDILTSCRLIGREPEVVEVVGIVSGDIDLRVGLSEAAQGSVPVAVEAAAAVLDRWFS